jgi:hypothetical protein
VVLVALAALIVAAAGLGVAQGGPGFLTKKKANKTFISKKKANNKFLSKNAAANQYQKLETRIQIPASMVGLARTDPETDYSDTNGASAGAQHLNTGFGSLGWSFVLPPHYPAGTPLNVKIIYAVTATGCNFHLVPNSLSVSNVGASVGGSQNDIGNPGAIHAAPPSQQAASLDWTIPATVTGGAGATLQPGSAVTFGTFRNSDNAGDTCAGIVAIKGIEVSWG